VVRTGADEALVEGRFSTGPDEGDEVLLARAVVRNGRSKAWIDGRMATVAALGEAARDLIELHGQHQHQVLVHTDAQRRALDAFGRIDLTALESARARLRHLADESEALGGDARQRAREVDLLAYQIEEIDQAAIEDGNEDRRLEQEEDRLAAADAHRRAAADALAAVSGSDGTSALDRLAEAAHALSGREPLTAIDARIGAAMADLSDLATELRGVVETWEDDPDRLEEIRARRQLFHQLFRKYGGTLDEVLAFADASRRRLRELAAEEERSQALDQEIAAARGELEEAEREVAAQRRAAAPRLASVVETRLGTLAMPSARFAVSVEGPGAAEQVTFLLGANTGEPLLPVAKAASGGELARTMLALRLAVTESSGLMVFDEVDAGVGGSAAIAVGAALAGLGTRAQVVVVTHLAQVAAQADHQFVVRKSERGGRTRSTVVALDRQGRITELSRMLSGHPDSRSARQHAAELLDGVLADGVLADGAVSDGVLPDGVVAEGSAR
jgi:DNA repair protein RecN (Recombination protein N)